jgi:hypothetical protein
MTKATYTGNSWLFNDSSPATDAWYWDNRGFPKLKMGNEVFPFQWDPLSVPVIAIVAQPQANTAATVAALPKNYQLLQV